MKFPIEWVREYAPVEWSDDELADRLTMSGSEVEEMTDGVMEIKVTPNRGDELSMLGIAREAAALAGIEVRKPQAVFEESGQPTEAVTSVDLQAPDLCPRYSARLITGVRVGPSPEWMARRLEAAGLRPINNVVDVTNYVMLEYGQPLHAFDFSLLRGGRIVVRRAAPGEKLTTIDGAERTLSPEMLVIADAERPVAVAGVMGGADSEIRESTTTVLLESAYFSPLSIRRTAKALGMSTDSSYRFERGVDPGGVVEASNRAAALIARLAGGTVAPGPIDACADTFEPRTLTLRPDRCNHLLGTDFTTDEMVDALARLGLRPRGTQPITVSVPTCRADLAREDDLAEEVGRILGYDRIPAAAPRGSNVCGGVGRREQFARALVRASIACGWQECCTATLVDDEACAELGFDATARLANPMSREIDVARPSLLPGLLDAVRRNLRQGRSGMGLFEEGPVFGMKDGHPVHERRWAVAMVGPVAGLSWTGKPAEADFFRLKGALEAILDEIGIESARFEPVEQAGFHPGRTARVVIGDRTAGLIGEIHPALAEAWDVSGRLVVAELDSEVLRSAMVTRPYRPVPRYPGVQRDVAVLVDRSVTHERITQTVAAAAGPLLRDITLFDIYRGESLGADKQSMAYRLTLQSDERTLSDAEATEVMDRVRAALAADVGASFR